jgi:hypothetical protein
MEQAERHPLRERVTVGTDRLYYVRVEDYGILRTI